MSEDITVFVGYDAREDIAYRVCDYSIRKHTPDVEVIPLKQQELRLSGHYWRETDNLSSTEFTFTRFLVPHLMDYKGWAIFCDCDFVWTEDVHKLLEQRNKNFAVMVVKHEHTPPEGTKMDGCKQTAYPRKNWSSMILWNCEHPANKNLTPEVVNTESGQYLHRFSWLKDNEIGELTPEWNWLVGWNKTPAHGTPKVYHWTEGGPWFENYRNCEYNNVWWNYLLESAAEMSIGFEKRKANITWVTSLSREYWSSVANITLPTWKNLPGDVVFVWDDKPIDLEFGQKFNFYKDVISSNDPWIAESMGGSKADRFWKKSRVQVWASRKFGGLVIWLDADIAVNRQITKVEVIEKIHPKDNVWGSIQCGKDWPLTDDCPIDTGIVGFNTQHANFENFLRDYSLTWYNGDIFKLPQPYDHHAANFVSNKWTMTTYAPHFNYWKEKPTEYISRYAMENSNLKDMFTHHLGIDNKIKLNQSVGNTIAITDHLGKKVKKQK
jgi:lipopolysaccharide biosynthesis glycosyltransferase